MRNSPEFKRDCVRKPTASTTQFDSPHNIAGPSTRPDDDWRVVGSTARPACDSSSSSVTQGK